jgi:hypothetical protein
LCSGPGGICSPPRVRRMNAAAAAPQAPPSCGSPAGAPSTFAGDLSDREGGLAAAASVAPGESGEAPEGRLLPPHRGPLAAPSPPPPPPAGRRRSLSVATGQPALETVVVKAKRAASSLWMLLHAQVSSAAAGASREAARRLWPLAGSYFLRFCLRC